jgi:hypothetical protein
MKKYNSKLDKTQKKKKEMDESEDYLKQIDKLGEEAGRKFVIDQVKEEEEQTKNKNNDVASSLQEHQDQRFTYKFKLCEYGLKKLDDIDYPTGWEHYIAPTGPPSFILFGRSFDAQDGIVVILKAPLGGVYVKAMSVTYNPVYDMHAVDMFCEYAEDTIDESKGLLLSKNKGEKRTKSGIIIP